MPAKILYLGAAEEDFAILYNRVRPSPSAIVSTAVVGRTFAPGDTEGVPYLPSSISGQIFDVVVYSPQVGTPLQREALFSALFNG